MVDFSSLEFDIPPIVEDQASSTKTEEERATESLMGMSLDSKLQSDSSGMPPDLSKTLEVGDRIFKGDETAVQSLIEQDRTMDYQVQTEKTKQELDQGLLTGEITPQVVKEKVDALEVSRTEITSPPSENELMERAIKLSETDKEKADAVISSLNKISRDKKLLDAIAAGDKETIKKLEHQNKFDSFIEMRPQIVARRNELLKIKNRSEKEETELNKLTESLSSTDAIEVSLFSPTDVAADVLTGGGLVLWKYATSGAFSLAASLPKNLLATAIKNADIKTMTRIFGKEITKNPVSYQAAVRLTKANFTAEFTRAVSSYMPKGITKAAIRDAGWGITAGGIMSVADMAYSDSTITALSGVVGTGATAALFGLTRKGIATWLAKSAQNDAYTWKAIKDIAEKHKTPLANVLREAFQSKEIGENIEFGYSHVVGMLRAADEVGSNSVKKEITDAIKLAAVLPQSTPLVSTVEKATGTEGLTKLIGLIQEGNPAASIGEVGEDFIKRFNNTVEASRILGNKVIWDDAVERAFEDKNMQNMARVSIYDGSTVSVNIPFSIRKGEKVARDISTNLVTRFLGSSRAKLQELAKTLVSDATVIDHRMMLVRKQTDKALRSALSPLSKKEKKALTVAMDAINQIEGTPTLAPNGAGLVIGDQFFPLSNKALDAYAKMRVTTDLFHHQMNAAFRDQLSKSGAKYMAETGSAVRQIPFDKAIDITDDLGTTLTKELYDRGYRAFKSIDNTARQVIRVYNPDEIATHIRDFKPTDKILNWQQHYVPIEYKDTWRAIRIKTNEDNSIEAFPVATAPSYRRGLKTIKLLEDEAKASGKGTKDRFILIRKDEDLSVTEASYSKGFADELHSLTPEQLNAFKNLMLRAGEKADVIDDILAGISHFSYKENTRMLQRGKRLRNETLTENAPLLDSFQSLSRYIDSTSKYVAWSSFKQSVENEFLKSYGRFLRNPNDMFSPIDPAKLPKKGGVREGIEVIQDHLREVFNLRTQEELIAETKWMNKARDLFDEGGVKNYLLGKGAESIPYLKEAIPGSLKSLAAHAKLGMWNVSQVLVQSSSIINTLGKFDLKSGESFLSTKNPANMAVKDLLKIFVGKGWDGEAAHLRDILLRSGFTQNDYANLSKYHSSFSGLRKFSNEVLHTGQIFYNTGESLQKALAFLATRRSMINDIMGGKSVKFGLKDIDSDKFLREVGAEASILSLNMSRFNQPAFSKKWWGVPFQFQQFATHQFELMFGKATTPREKIGIWGRWIGTFGPIGGIPFLGDAVFLSESASADFKDDPSYIGKTQEYLGNLAWSFGQAVGGDDEKFWKNLGKKGGLKALTDGELDIVHRAGVGYMAQNWVDGLDWTDLAGPSGDTLFKIVSAAPKTMGELIDIFNEDADVNMGVFVEQIRPFSGPYNFTKAIQAGLNNEYTDGNARLIKSKPTMKELFMVAAGVQPGEFVEAKESLFEEIRFKKAMDELINEKVDDAMSAYTGKDMKQFKTIIDDTVGQISEVSPVYIKDFFKKLIWKQKEAGLDLSTRLGLLSVKNLRLDRIEKMGKKKEKTNEEGNFNFTFPDPVPPSDMEEGTDTEDGAGLNKNATVINFITKGEGNVNAVNQGKPVPVDPIKVWGEAPSEMSVEKIMELQRLPKGHPKRMFAVGMFQVIPSTLEKAYNAGVISKEEAFTEEVQKRVFDFLITEKRPKIGRYVKEGVGSEDAALLELAKEWASVPVPYDVYKEVKGKKRLIKAGESYYKYEGNKANHSLEETRRMIQEWRNEYNG